MTALVQTYAAASLPVAPAPICSQWPRYEEDEIAEAVAILRSGRVNSLHHGDHTRAFEEAFARWIGMPHAIAVANGTLALELALRALGIGPGDEVIVPARSFIASASCVAAVGAQIVFADVNGDTQGISAESVAAVLTPRTRAVIAVHLGGCPCDIAGIAALARATGLYLIEDCAQAHGAAIAGRRVGSFGDAAAFSFCTDKIMSTAGEGGMLLLRDGDAWDQAWSYKDHGKAPPAPIAVSPLTPASPGTFRWLHRSLGSNLRLTELQAAIGLRQLGKVERWLTARADHAATLDDAFAPLPAIRFARIAPEVRHAYYKYYAFVRPERLRNSWSRDRIVATLIERGIPAGTGSCPEIYREQAFAMSAARPAMPLPVAHALGETSIMLPVDHTLDDTAIDRMADTCRAVLDEASW